MIKTTFSHKSEIFSTVVLQNLDKIDTINYLKANVDNYFPGLIQLLGTNQLDWAHINSLFEKEHEERVRRFELEGSQAITVEVTIYDIIVEVKKENPRAINLLDYFNKLMFELATHLDEAERKLIVATIRSVLVSLNMSYLNFIGEMAVLNGLVKSKLYKLLKVEERLPNKKSLDFKFERTSDNKIQLAEIVNLHLDDNKVNANGEQIRKFLDGRLIAKIKDKKSKLKEDIHFFLIPVIWGNARSLKIYSDYFSENEMHIENVIEPAAYVTFRDPDDPAYVLHHFKTVSHLFNVEGAREINFDTGG